MFYNNFYNTYIQAQYYRVMPIRNRYKISKLFNEKKNKQYVRQRILIADCFSRTYR